MNGSKGRRTSDEFEKCKGQDVDQGYTDWLAEAAIGDLIDSEIAEALQGHGL